MARQLSNWGRWGRYDEHGALNLITLEVLGCGVGVGLGGRDHELRALELAKTPVIQFMARAGDISSDHGRVRGLESNGDGFLISPHGMANTHIGALCRILD